MAGDKDWLPLVPSFVYLYPDRRTYLSVGVCCFQLLTFHLDVFFPFGYVEMPNKGNWDTAVPTSSVGITTPRSQMSCKRYHIATSASLFCAHHQNVAFCVGFQGFLKKRILCFSFLFLIFKWQMVRKYRLHSYNYFPVFLHQTAITLSHSLPKWLFSSS